MNGESLRLLGRPAWLGLIALAIVAAATAALWMGLQQDTKQTATTFVFARRVGYLNRPIPLLDDHLDEIINSVEFPAVFEAIEERTLLSSEDDYDFTIEQVDDTQSVVEIEVRADRAGDAERIARILAEEIVTFVLTGQDAQIDAEIAAIDGTIIALLDEQSRLEALAGGFSPVVAQNRYEGELLGIGLDDADAPLGNVEAEIRAELAAIRPMAEEYGRNAGDLRQLYADRARARTEQMDIRASLDGINGEWYRSITPVTSASNIPIAVAMAFAAAVPAALVAFLLAAINVNRRLTGRLFTRGPREPSLA